MAGYRLAAHSACAECYMFEFLLSVSQPNTFCNLKVTRVFLCVYVCMCMGGLYTLFPISFRLLGHLKCFHWLYFVNISGAFNDIIFSFKF